MKKKGFTLIELVVVIALIAILAVTLAPRLRDQIAKAKDAKCIAVLGALRTNTQVFFAEREQTVIAAHTTGEDDALSFLIGELEPGTQKLFTAWYDDTVVYSTAGLVTTDGGSHEIGIGGRRVGSAGDVVYGGYLGFDFSDADGLVASPDGVSMILSVATPIDAAGVDATYTHDTKRKVWASY